MDWALLRHTNHSKARLYQLLLKWSENPSEENLTAVLDGIVPLVHWVIDDGFSWIKDQDRDGIVSEVVYRISKKLDYFVSRCGSRKALSAMLWVTVRRMVIDYLRANDLLGVERVKVDPLQVGYKIQVSVEKQVDAKLILEDLPGQVASFALARDRFCFGARVLRVVASLMIEGHKVPESMLRNWYKVKNPRLCINFMSLMCRLFVYIYRKKFEELLDEKSYSMIDEVGRRVIIEDW